MDDPCHTPRPDCTERFRWIDAANVERDAALHDLAEKLDTIPDRIVSRVLEALGAERAQMARNSADIQELFRIAGILERSVAQIEGAGVMARVGIPVIASLVSAAVSFGAAFAILK